MPRAGVKYFYCIYIYTRGKRYFFFFSKGYRVYRADEYRLMAVLEFSIGRLMRVLIAASTTRARIIRR